jgi:hypothetical protein
MKRFAPLIISLVLAGQSYSQQDTGLIKSTGKAAFKNEKRKYPIPEFNHKPAYYEESTNSLRELEKPRFYSKTKQNLPLILIGKVSSGTYIFADSAKSPVRFLKEDSISFLMRVPFDNDPSDTAEVAVCEIRKAERGLLVSESPRFRGTIPLLGKIPYHAKKIFDNAYLLVFVNMQAGEYFMITRNGLFAFGIDTNEKDIE